jgi:nucleoside-diphosphate-sugar epimerase
MTNKVFVTGGSGFVGRNLIPILIQQGYLVVALARSDSSAKVVEDLGATVARGDLDNISAMRSGMQDCSAVIHSAAYVEDWGTYEAFYQANVQGTLNALEAARQAKVSRFVFISTEAVLMGGDPLVNADETWAYPTKPMGLYATTKGMAEQEVLKASTDDLVTVSVRPRFVWGKGDTTLLPRVIEIVKSGGWMWMNEGRHLTSTCHIKNTCEGIIKALENGKPANAYFLTDGAPIEFRTFLTGLLKTQNVDPGSRSIPVALAKVGAILAEGIWNLFGLKSTPPITRTLVVQAGMEVTVNDAKARREIGYVGAVTHEQGFQELRG